MPTATPPQNSPNSTPQVLAGRTFRMMRETHGVSLRQLAELVDSSASHLSRIESGERVATADLTQRICDAIASLPAPERSA